MKLTTKYNGLIYDCYSEPHKLRYLTRKLNDRSYKHELVVLDKNNHPSTQRIYHKRKEPFDSGQLFLREAIELLYY